MGPQSSPVLDRGAGRIWAKESRHRTDPHSASMLPAFASGYAKSARTRCPHRLQCEILTWRKSSPRCLIYADATKCVATLIGNVWRLLLGEENLYSPRRAEQPFVRPSFVALISAGHNAFCGSGPDQKPAFDDAMADGGCPDRGSSGAALVLFELPTVTSQPDYLQ